MSITLGSRPLTIPTAGLILKLDASDTASYPGTGTVWYDTSGYGNNFNISAAAYNSTGPKYMDFQGLYGVAKRSPDMMISSKAIGEATYICWTRIKNSTAEWRTLTRALTVGGDHNVIIESGGVNIGVYDGNNSSGFNSTGYSQTNLPGNGTPTWIMLIFRYNTVAPYFTISYNDTPGTIRGSSSSINASMKYGICSIGGYNNGDAATPTNAGQYWGDIGAFFVYNRVLTDAEALQCYNAGAKRFFPTTAAQTESIVTYADGTVQPLAFSPKIDTGSLLKTFTYSTAGTCTWTKPTGCNRVLVTVIGGGGGGGGYNESGGAGGYAEKVIDVTSVASVTVTIGAAGAGVAYSGGAGSGGTSSFGSYCSATGGYGANVNVSHTGGHGGIGSSGDVNLIGGSGSGHGDPSNANSPAGNGGAGFWGSGYKAAHSNNSQVGNSAPGAGGGGHPAGRASVVGNTGAAGMITIHAYS